MRLQSTFKAVLGEGSERSTAGRSWSTGSPADVVPGPPPGVPWETLSERLEVAIGARIVGVAHRPISQWKGAGAQRMWLEVEDGRRQTMVLKRLDYSAASLPAANVLPFDISRSERLVYERADDHPRVIPRTFLTLDLHEVGAGEDALVVMEDLASGWTRPRLHHDYALIVMKLDDIQAAMTQAGEKAAGTGRQVRYDPALAGSLAQLFEGSVMAEPAVTEGHDMGRLLAGWPEVREVLTQSVLPDVPSGFVHGDLSPANTFVRWLPSPQVRVIDFEWLGFGYPHADLACLLKRARPSIERTSLRLYAARHRSHSPSEHRTVYEWCQVCRGLLDAAYFVNHWRMLEPARKSALPRYARMSLRRAWLAAGRLGAAVSS